jgi:enoyl-CoA hydratase/carnithine racemase
MGDIRVEKDGGVWLVTIDRPDKMNSLDFDAHYEMVEVWKAFNADDAARVGVVTGAGDKAFCAGADLKTYTMDFATRPPHEFREEFVEGFGLGGITRGMEVDKPLIAAVNGYAISGGLEIALACDLRFAAPNAEFALQDSKWGFHACDGALIRLPMIVGLGHAMEIILSGDRVGAARAAEIGLVNRVWPADELLARSMDYAQKLASRAPLAHRFAKQTLRRVVGMPFDEALKTEVRSFYDLGRTEDLAEGTAAFRERRPADFKGR